MKFGILLLARFGLFAPKSAKITGPDQFDLRLQRIGFRERRHEAQPLLFRNRRSPLEA